ncbi:hypothetical protein WICMUC_001584 [Wickerhamomyces mucosus]|uniref:Thiol-specific monooxygenase n=1 Tax=Wickerhamomyces mucosus TaxID=1378264 RepID=A0A9P8THB0_9ASCO|nr:hypothetical protein WICMUC_001584 [Wickerhamomyces mucosus]
MTVDKQETFNIKKIAIIGGGISGISALYEFLHTSSDGKSYVGKEEPENQAFESITLFERNDELGGNWLFNSRSDPKFPEQEQLDNGDYSKPEALDTIYKGIPTDENLSKASKEDPFITNVDNETIRWNNSAAYPALFSNILGSLVRVSSGLNHYKVQKGNPLYPFSTAGQIQNDLLKFVKEQNLKRFIEFNTTVEKAQKIGGSWVLTLQRINKETGKAEWYTDKFDAIVTANGHYSIPFIPYFENLNVYNKRHPDDLWHTKAVKEFSKFKDQNVLIIGSNASSIDVIKFLVGDNAKSITISRRSVRNQDSNDPRNYKFTDEIFNHKDIILKPKISEISINGDDPKDDEIKFLDGTTGKYDKIIFATGYHFHYPFLVDKSLTQLGQIADANSKFSLVKTLYLYTFAINDPTFATIGVQQSPFLWATMESQASAIAGIWSNVKKLPSVETQQEWLRARNEDKKFHIFNLDTAKPDLADKAIELAPHGRVHPFDVLNVEKEEVEKGWDQLIKLYESFRTGELTFQKIKELGTLEKSQSLDKPIDVEA